MKKFLLVCFLTNYIFTHEYFECWGIKNKDSWRVESEWKKLDLKSCSSITFREALFLDGYLSIEYNSENIEVSMPLKYIRPILIVGDNMVLELKRNNPFVIAYGEKYRELCNRSRKITGKWRIKGKVTLSKAEKKELDAIQEEGTILSTEFFDYLLKELDKN